MMKDHVSESETWPFAKRLAGVCAGCRRLTVGVSIPSENVFLCLKFTKCKQF